MIYIYDILLNFTDTDKIYEFFEWEESDDIDHIKKIPLVKLSTAALSDLTHKKVKIASSFLSDIENKTEIFEGKKVSSLPYAFLATDGRTVAALECNESGVASFRSRLLLDEEEEILEIAERLEEESLSYEVIKPLEDYHYCTRKEETIRKYLLREIKSAYQNHEETKIHYFYSEFFRDKEKKMDAMYQKLLASLNSYLTETHLKLYQLLKKTHSKKQV